MRNETNLWAVAALVAGTMAASGAGAGSAAASTSDPYAAVRACVAERDDARRLACFDRAASGLPADATARPADAGAAAARSMTPEERFGYQGQVAREELDRQKAEENALEELGAKVAKVGAQPSGDFLVTLDNGQVWAQIPTGRPTRLKVDDAVTIRRASLGSYMLSGPYVRGVRVRRVK